MRHLTSYPFYTKFIEKGYLEEIDEYPQIEHNIVPNSRQIITDIVNKYGSLSNYLKSNSNEFQEIEECVYHETTFKITNKFIKRYQRKK